LAVSGIETDAAVEYSIDGGATWAGTFAAIEGKNKVQVRQVDAAGNPSQAASIVFTLDTIGPVAPSVSLKLDTGASATDLLTSVGALAVSGVETDASVEYSVDGGATWAGTFAAIEGKNSVQVRQVDAAGTPSPAASIVFTLDTTAAAAPIPALINDTGTSATDWVTTDGRITLSGVEAGAAVEYSTDGGATWSDAFNAVPGEQTVRVRQIDPAGNISPAAEFTLTLVAKDIAAPTVALTKDTGSSNIDRITNVGTLAVGGLVKGAVAEYSADGGDTWSRSFTAVEGANDVRVRQVDLAGNISAAASILFTLDTAVAAPTLALGTDTGSSATDGITSKGAVAVGNLESKATVQYSVTKGVTWVPTFTAVEGLNSVLVRQVDTAGNVSAAAALEFTLDTKLPLAPTVALKSDTGTSLTDKITNVGTLSLGAVEASAFVEYSADAGATWSDVFAAVEGVNNVLVRQRDLAGNVSAATKFAFTLDTVVGAPGVTLASDTGPSATDRVTSKGTLAVSDLESGARASYSTDGGVTWKTTFAAVQGKNAVWVRQSDVAGNVSSAVTLDFTLDTVAPVTPGARLMSDTGTSAVDRRSRDGTLVFTGVEATATASISIDAGATWLSGAVIPDGSHASVLVRQIDLAGNVSGSGDMGAVFIRSSLPIPRLTLASDTGSSATDRVTRDGAVVPLNVQPQTAVQYSTDGGKIWALSFKAREGANSVLVRQSDDLGNVATIDKAYEFTLDTAAAAPVAALAVDSGVSGLDLITNSGAIAASGLETGATVEYSADLGNTWTATFAATEGANSVAVRQV
ncbi:MAG: Ig-like domain repeat protein, partial [Planctomycetaceae bacterium]